MPIENHLKEKISKNDPAPEAQNNQDDEDSEYDPASKSLYSSDSEDIDIEKNNQLKEFDSTLSERWEKYLLSPGGGSEKPRDARHHTGQLRFILQRIGRVACLFAKMFCGRNGYSLLKKKDNQGQSEDIWVP